MLVNSQAQLAARYKKATQKAKEATLNANSQQEEARKRAQANRKDLDEQYKRQLGVLEKAEKATE